MCLINMIAAKIPLRKESQARQEDELEKGLDLQGLLQRQFLANTALADITKNSVASPFSALVLLGVLAKGAVGNGLQELEAGIGFKRKEIQDYFKLVFDDLSNMKNTSLCISNKIYLQKGVQLQKDYKKALWRTFKTTSQQVDFMKEEETVNLINKWVSKNTNGKIPRMLDVSDVDPEDVIFLITTLDFAAHWMYPFQETKDRFITPFGVKNVDMMQSKGLYKYAESSTLGAEIVGIPYVDRGVEFYIVLPREKNISRLMDVVRADVEALDDGLKRMKLTHMTLVMPMFQIEAKFDLVQIFQELGVHQIFQDRNAGLNKMFDSINYPTSYLHISKTIQKAYINVTALGTVAGTASASRVFNTRDMPPLKVKVDRPFLYFVLAAKQQLFTGIVVDPAHK